MSSFFFFFFLIIYIFYSPFSFLSSSSASSHNHSTTISRLTSSIRVARPFNTTPDYSSGCKAFEYGMNYGGGGGYKARDCQLQNSANSRNGRHHNLDLYTKSNNRYERTVDQYDTPQITKSIDKAYELLGSRQGKA